MPDSTTQKQTGHELKMGTEKIPKLLISMSLPAMISMLVQACYNVVDSVFVSFTGEASLTAVSLAFPLQTIVIALAVGMGVGINSGISRRLGEKREEEAVFVAEHGLLLALILSILIIPFGYFGVRPFAAMFSSDADIIQKTYEYASIVMIFAFGGIICQAGFAILQGTGNMIQPMIGQLIGAILNIVLDPIMIFGMFDFPALGVAGAAVATVLGQIVGMIYIMCVVFFSKKRLLHLDFRQFRYKGAIMADIIRVGLPSAVMQGIGSFMTTGFNMILSGFGPTPIAVFGVYFKLQSFIFMPIFGLGQGAMPIFGYNYGARQPKRFQETLKCAVIISVAIMLVGFALFQFIPDKLLLLFNPSDQMIAIGSECLRVISWSFPLAGVSIMLSNSFQAIGKSYVSMIGSFLRQLVVLLPAAWLLARVGGVDACWWSFLIAEVVSLTYLYLMYQRTTRSIFRQWKEDAES